MCVTIKTRCMSAMALAASMMTMGASAEISNANFNDGKD